MTIELHLETSYLEHACRIGRRGTAQSALHACDQFIGLEGLGDIIVGADFQPDDLVGYFVLAAKDNDGQMSGKWIVPNAPRVGALPVPLRSPEPRHRSLVFSRDNPSLRRSTAFQD